MSSHFESYALPPAVQRIAGAFRIVGWVSFWGQVVLGVISSLVLLFSDLILKFGNQANNELANNPGSAMGFFLALLGIVALFLGAYWAFRYTRMSRQLRSRDGQSRPKPSQVIQSLRIGLLINLMGMLLTLLGGEALIGSLFAKALSQPQTGIAFYERITQAIQPIDILIVQANTNTVLAHFVGLVGTLWLVRCMSRQS